MVGVYDIFTSRPQGVKSTQADGLNVKKKDFLILHFMRTKTYQSVNVEIGSYVRFIPGTY